MTACDVIADITLLINVGPKQPKPEGQEGKGRVGYGGQLT